MAEQSFEDEEADGGDTPKRKAEWRRANSSRIAHQRGEHAVVTRRRSVRHSHGARISPSSSSKMAKAKHPALFHHDEAEARIHLADWFRITLGEQAQFALQMREKEELEASWSQSSDHDVIDVHQITSLFELDSPTTVARASPRIYMVDEGTQCCPEEMLEPMARSALFQRCCMQRLRCGPLDRHTSWSVASHFSQFEEPAVVVKIALQHSEIELRRLAGRFLGLEVAGVRIERRSGRPARKVAERHVVEAWLLSQSVPAFRAALLASARRLLLGGLSEVPLHGRSLLKLAHSSPGCWAKLAHTAIDFAGRLILSGALPRAFAAELLAEFASLPPNEEGCKMSCLGLLIILPAVSRPYDARRVSFLRSSHPTRTSSVGYTRCLSPPLGPVTRTQSAPATYTVHRRDVGTSLHSQDESQPYSSISFNSTTKSMHDVIPSTIEAAALADYWRFAAGGEHTARQLEEWALCAEEDCHRVANGHSSFADSEQQKTTANGSPS